jgi:GTPase SAR1 family protein
MSNMHQSKFDVKVVILGSEYSGKTCLAQRFLRDKFVGDNKYQVTIALELRSYSLPSNSFGV